MDSQLPTRWFKLPKFRKPTWHEVGIFFAWVAVISAIIVFSLFIYLERTLPDPASIADRKVSESTKIYDRTGQVLLYDIHGNEKRTIIPWEQIPLNVRNATMAAEDSSFYSHGAFDIKGILRSLYTDVTTLSFSQGGSTLTQQLVKNAILGSEKSPLRKLKELVLSIEIERRYTKDQIFWMYLNEIPYGSNAYGIQSAAKTYFNENASDLDLAQSAILASIIQAPTHYSPYGSHVDELMARKNLVLTRMRDLGFISDADYQSATAEKLTFKSSTEEITAPHFVILVKDYLEQKYGVDAVENGGLNVITTLDASLQQVAEDTVTKYVAINKVKYQASNAAMVSVDPKTGDVLTLVGSANYFDTANQGNFDVATDGQGRQPGSSFKPFAYAEAFSKGYPDSTVLWDLKTEFNPSCSPDGNQTTDQYGQACYHPQDYSGKFSGPVTMRSAIDESLNVPSVQVLYLAGIPDTINLAQQMGITTLTDPTRYGLSLVLGGAEVHPIDIVSAYSAFANDGVHNPWRIVLQVQDANGNVLEQAKDQSQRVLDTQTARLMDDVLSDNNARAPEFGYNSSLYIPGHQVAAKTGTTQDNRDAWVIGFTPDIATVVWTGNNDNSPMTREGAGISASGPMWHEFMTKALANYPNDPFPKPDPVTSTKTMLNGTYAYNPDGPGGPTQYHSILYYVNKDDPQGAMPALPQNDPQFNNWEWAVQNYFAPGSAPQNLIPSPTPIVGQ